MTTEKSQPSTARRSSLAAALKVVSAPTSPPPADAQRPRRPRRKRRTIAAIVPLFNGGRFIEQALQSILAQSRSPDEVVVVDDGSTDDGPAKVEALAARMASLRLVRQPNAGQSAARNRGAAETRADLLAFLDQDDAWYPDHLKKLVAPFEAARPGSLGWVYSNLDEVDVEGRLVNRSFLDTMAVEHPKRHLTACLGTDMYVLPSASLVAREAFEEVGGFDERLSGYEDDDLFLRLFRARYDNQYLAEPLSLWRIHATSSTFTYRMAASAAIYATKLLADYPDTPGLSRYYQRDLIAPRFVQVMLREYRAAVKEGNRPVFDRAVQALSTLVPHLADEKKARFERVWPVLSSYPLARATFHLRHPLRSLIVGLGILD